MYIWIEQNKEIDRLKRINTMSEDEFIKWQEEKNPSHIIPNEINRPNRPKRRPKTIFKPNLN